VLNDRLANDVRQNGTHSSETDDDRVLQPRKMLNPISALSGLLSPLMLFVLVVISGEQLPTG